MNISQSFRKGRNTHLVPNEYLQIQKYRQTALNGVQLGRAQIKQSSIQKAPSIQRNLKYEK